MGTRSRIMSAPLDTTIIILAGGESRRMQQDKAELKIGQQTLLQLLIDKFAMHVAEIYISSSKQHLVTNQYIPDLWIKKLGPVGAIVSSILYLQTSHLNQAIIFTPVDMPKISLTEFQQLLNNKSNGAYFINTPLPLMLKVTSQLINHCQNIASLLDNGHDYSIKKFIAESGIIFEQCQCLNPQQLINVNYPYEWEQFCHETSM